MATSKNDQIAAVYDERSASYDQTFHPRQAEDFVKWAELKEGQQVLDVCCGTGLVALSAKKEVGHSGNVVAMDISERMMDEGRRKAVALNLDVAFMYGDCSKIVREDLLSPDVEGFNVITCASGLVLLDDPQTALELWASLLAPDGKLIVDVPVEEAILGGTILQQVLEKADLPSVLLYKHNWISSVDSLRNAILIAGLTPLRVFETLDYVMDRFDASEASERFENLIRYSQIGDLKDLKLRQRVKSEFEVRIKGHAGSGGKIQQNVRFYVAIATKRR